MTEIPVAPLPHSIEFTDDGTRGYLADHTSDVVSVIVTATDTVLREVPVDAGPHSVAVHPDRPLAADVNDDASTVTVIDTTTDTVVPSIPVGDGPQDVTWAPDGHFAYVTNLDEGTLRVLDLDGWADGATRTAPWPPAQPVGWSRRRRRQGVLRRCGRTSCSRETGVGMSSYRAVRCSARYSE